MFSVESANITHSQRCLQSWKWRDRELSRQLLEVCVCSLWFFIYQLFGVLLCPLEIEIMPLTIVVHSNTTSEFSIKRKLAITLLKKLTVSICVSWKLGKKSWWSWESLLCGPQHQNNNVAAANDGVSEELWAMAVSTEPAAGSYATIQPTIPLFGKVDTLWN